MFVTRGERWKRHARVVLPMLKRAKIAQYVDTIVACTDRFIETQLIKDNGGKNDLIAKCQAFLLSIIVSIAFDSDSKKVDGEQQALSKALKVGRMTSKKITLHIAVVCMVTECTIKTELFLGIEMKR